MARALLPVVLSTLALAAARHVNPHAHWHHHPFGFPSAVTTTDECVSSTLEVEVGGSFEYTFTTYDYETAYVTQVLTLNTVVSGDAPSSEAPASTPTASELVASSVAASETPAYTPTYSELAASSEAPITPTAPYVSPSSEVPASSELAASSEAPITPTAPYVSPSSEAPVSSEEATTFYTSTSAVAFPSYVYPSSETTPAAASTTPAAASTTASSTSAGKSAPTSPTLPVLRGVNLGGWLILEPLYAPELLNGSIVDQWTYDAQDNSAPALKDHWESYCNESVIQTLAGYGINALRIPIGYWAYDNSDTPYHSGADAYLEAAIGWARDAGMYVLVDLHGVPGQQNDAAGCGHVADVAWSSEADDPASDMAKTTNILLEMAKKYGAEAYADTVIGISLVNEPSNDLPNNLTLTQEWTESTFAQIRDAADNKELHIAMHDQWVTPKWWIPVNAKINQTAPNGIFNMDLHQYQIFNSDDRAEDQDAHISEVCTFVTEQVVLAKDNNFPLFVGEFGGNTLICVNDDGSTFADPDGLGQACGSNTACQCEADGGLDLQDWRDPIVQEVRRYVEVQMQYFEKYSMGWFFWNFQGPGAWGFIGGVEKGFIPQPLDNYTYSDQCASAGL